MSIGQRLSRLAERRGLDPSAIPSIKQVSFIASFDRGRAAEIAGNVRNYIKRMAKPPAGAGG